MLNILSMAVQRLSKQESKVNLKHKDLLSALVSKLLKEDLSRIFCSQDLIVSRSTENL